MIDVRWLRGSGVLLGLLLGSMAAMAQTPSGASESAPGRQPPLFSRAGVINSVNPAAGMIVVNDVQYRLPQGLRVYTYERGLKDHGAQRSETRAHGAKVLREGVRIGFNVRSEGGGQRSEVTEAWLLPAGHIPELAGGEKSEGLSKGESKGASEGARTQRTTPRTPTTR